MLTRCPECSTSFRVTAEQLRLAQGAVRCGNCEAVFDALSTLSEDQPENALDQTEDEQNDLESPVEDTEDSPTGPADSDIGDESVDYDQLSGQLSGYFRETDEPDSRPVESGPVATEDTVPSVPKLPADADSPESSQEEQVSAASGTADWAVADSTNDTTGTTDEDETLESMFDAADDDSDAPVFVVEGEASHTDSPENDPEHGKEAADDIGTGRTTEFATSAAANTATDLEDFGEYSQDPLAQFDTVKQEEIADPGIPGWEDLSPTADSADQPRSGAVANNRWWTIGSAVLLITLLGQLAHNNRDALATDERYGEFVRSVYSSLGIPVYPEWDLGAYEIRGSEAVSGESRAGVLDIRAQMMIKGTEAVGEPLLRIVLRDRWSNLVARGVFSAAEYRSDSTSAGAMLRPGNMLPISVSVEDPGDAAQGYELDLCVMTRHAGLKCDRKAER